MLSGGWVVRRVVKKVPGELLSFLRFMVRGIVVVSVFRLGKIWQPSGVVECSTMEEREGLCKKRKERRMRK